MLRVVKKDMMLVVVSIFKNTFSNDEMKWQCFFVYLHFCLYFGKERFVLPFFPKLHSLNNNPKKIEPFYQKQKKNIKN